VRPKPYRRSRGPGKILTKLFVWVVLTIFVLTSVGVALVALH
jgi:preprotein translocase subunit SecG